MGNAFSACYSTIEQQINNLRCLQCCDISLLSFGMQRANTSDITVINTVTGSGNGF